MLLGARMSVSHIACIRQKQRNEYHLIRKSEGQGILGRLTHTWEDNIKMYFKKRWECEHQIHISPNGD
jgi:hypothetical protein